MKKRLQFVSAITAASFVLAGCGGASTETKDAGVGDDAGATLTKADFIKTITAAQQKAKSSHISMTISGSGQKISAKGDVEVGATAADSKAALTMNLGSLGVGVIELRLIDKDYYINLGPMSGNKFAKIDLADTSNPMFEQYGGFLDQLDPSKQLEQFKGALTSVEKKGNAVTLDGVKAQPYVLTLDAKKIKGLGDFGAAPGAKLPDTLTYTMFVGSDNLPRRLVTTVAGSKLTLDYSTWGKSVDIKAPSKGEIADPSILEHMGDAPA